MIDWQVYDLAHGWGRGFEKDLELFGERIEAARRQSPPFSISDLAVNGSDIMNILGLQSGPKVGKILNQLLEVVIERPEHNQKDKLIEILKDMGE